MRKEYEGLNRRDLTAKREEIFKNEIRHCIESTQQYEGNSTDYQPDQLYDTVVVMDSIDSAKAVHKYASEGKVAVLNFADYKHAGGGFMQGMCAQEEALCQSSILYSCLIHFEDTVYAKNRTRLNRGLYQDNLLYTPDVIFDTGDVNVKADVITCAAPNARPLLRYRTGTKDEIILAMINRVNHLLYAAAVNQPDVLILGAFGCGVFGNDPTTTARIFKLVITEAYKGVFKKIVFAIPAGDNYDQFAQELRELCQNSTTGSDSNTATMNVFN